MRKPGLNPLCSKTLEQFRQRAISELLFQHGFGFGIATGDRIPDHDQVWFAGEILLCESADHLDAPLGQKGRHRGIDVLVGPGDTEAFLLHRGGDGGHSRAADAHKVN